MSIYKNGIASIQVGVIDMQSSDQGRIISGLRSIHAGILLLIKEKLVRLSPLDSDEVLIKQKIKPSIDVNGCIKFIGEGNKTVDVNQMIERTKALGVTIDWARIDAITKIRNDAEHYYTSLSNGAIKSALAKSFIVIRDTLEAHLGEDPLDALGEDTWQHLLSNAEVYDKERRECLSKIQSVEWDSDTLSEAIESATCDECGSDLLLPQDTGGYREDLELKCRSCGAVTKFADFAPEALHGHYSARAYMIAKDGGDDEIINCPHCGEFGYILDEEKCSICGESAQQVCSRCGCNIPSSEISDGDMCGYCQHMWDKMEDE